MFDHSPRILLSAIWYLLRNFVTMNTKKPTKVSI